VASVAAVAAVAAASGPQSERERERGKSPGSRDGQGQKESRNGRIEEFRGQDVAYRPEVPSSVPDIPDESILTMARVRVNLPCVQQIDKFTPKRVFVRGCEGHAYDPPGILRLRGRSSAKTRGTYECRKKVCDANEFSMAETRLARS
jgi:hypothetical protein